MSFSLQAVRRHSNNLTLYQHVSIQRHEPGLPLELYHVFPGGSFGQQEIPGKMTQYVWTLSARPLVLAFMEYIISYSISQRTKMTTAVDLIRDYQEEGVVDPDLLEEFRAINPDPYFKLPDVEYLGGLFDARGHIRLDESQQRRVWPLLEVITTPPHKSLIPYLINTYGGHLHDQQVWVITSYQALAFLEHISATSEIMSPLINTAISYQKALFARHGSRMARDDNTYYFTSLPDKLMNEHADQLKPHIDAFNQTKEAMLTYNK